MNQLYKDKLKNIGSDPLALEALRALFKESIDYATAFEKSNGASNEIVGQMLRSYYEGYLLFEKMLTKLELLAVKPEKEKEKQNFR